MDGASGQKESKFRDIYSWADRMELFLSKEPGSLCGLLMDALECKGDANVDSIKRCKVFDLTLAHALIQAADGEFLEVL